MTDADQPLLVYDKQCPACSNYSRWVRVRETAGELKLVNAREDSAVMEEITARGLDIDAGMVLKIGGELYHGPDALHRLALISSRSGWMNRLNYWIFRSPRLSRVFYPLLKGCRNLLLKLKGVTKINNLNQDSNDNF